MAEAGEFDFEPLFLLLDDAIRRIGARRVVLDTIESLFGAFKAQAIVRDELARLFRWLEDREVTAIVTGEPGDNDALTRHGIEEYVSDCVIALDHRSQNEVSTRRLQVVKYRGSAHETNQYPFLISARGFTVLPITAVMLDYGAPEERISTGVPRLDYMLAGGLFRGSAVLVSGSAGTGKTTLGAHLIDAACARGERALLILHEESAGEVIRNMRSVGLDLRTLGGGGPAAGLGGPAERVRPGELTWRSCPGCSRSTRPQSRSSTGLASLLDGSPRGEVISMLARKFNLFKARGITTMATILTEGDAETAVGVSSQADTWLLLRNDESNGERNRLLFVLKSRGSANSNQVREFVLTDHGVELVDVYVGPAGVMTGSARLSQETRDRDAKLQQQEDLQRRTRELRRGIMQDRRSSTRCKTNSPRSRPSWSGSRAAKSAWQPMPRRPGRPWALSAGQIRPRR